MCCIPLLSVLTAHAALSDMQKGQAPPTGITNSHFGVTAGLPLLLTSHTPWAACGHTAMVLNTWGWGRGVGHHCIMTKYGSIFWPIAVWLCELLEECNFTRSSYRCCVQIEIKFPNPCIPDDEMLHNTCTLPVCCSTCTAQCHPSSMYVHCSMSLCDIICTQCIICTNVMTLFHTCMSRHQHSLCFSIVFMFENVQTVHKLCPHHSNVLCQL